MFNRSQNEASPPAPEPGCCETLAVDENRVARARRAMLDDEAIEDTLEIFKVLSHPTRVRLLKALSVGELCVCELAEVAGLSVSATSHQLRDLRRLKVVQYRMEGRLAFYTVRDPFVLSLLDSAVAHYAPVGAR